MKRNKIIMFVVLLSLFAYLHESERRFSKSLAAFRTHTLYPDSTKSANQELLSFIEDILPRTANFSSPTLSLNN